MRLFLARAAFFTFALFVLAFWLLPPDSSAEFPREFRVHRAVPGPAAKSGVLSDRASGVLSDRAPVPAFVSEVLRRRLARDCFGSPAAVLRERVNPFGTASRRDVAAAAQAPITIRVLVLRVDFLSDRMGSQTTTQGGGFDLRRGTTAFIDPPPHNRDYFAAHMQALSRYYEAMSNGQFVIQSSVFPVAPDSAFHLSDTADYGPWTYADADYEIAVRLITDAVQAADLSAEPIVFSDYDLVYVFHAGADLQGDINYDSTYDIPSFTAGLAEPVRVDGGSSYVYAATVLPETVTQDGLTGAINGVTAHETGHMLGLPDMYNTEDFWPSVGYWSLMDIGNYLGGDVWDPTAQRDVFVFGLLPGGLDPYCRRELGRLYGVETLEEVVVDETWADTLLAVESSFRVLRVPLSASEYYLIENRQSELDANGQIVVTADPATGVILGPESNEYDALLPGSGILAWHVDEKVIASRASRGLGPNGGLLERGIDPEEADGIEDLGDPYSAYWLGSEFDPYFVGNATLLTPSTTPNSDVNSGTSSHVYVVVASPRAVGMRVSVNRQWAKSGWPVVTRNIAGSVPGFGDFDYDGHSEVFLAGSDSTLRVWTSAGETYLAGESEGFFARAPGSVMPVVCIHPLTALVGTVSVAGEGKLYAWALNDVSAPILAGQVRPGWPPAIPSVTTSPCAMNDDVVAGCSDGRVHAVNLAAAESWASASVSGSPVTGSIAAGYLDGPSFDPGYEVAYSSGRRWVHCVRSGTGEDVFAPFALPPEAAADTAGPFVLMADMDGRPDSTLEVLVVLQSGQAFALSAAGELLGGWPVSLDDTVLSWPSAGDVDADGLAELVVHSAGGRVYVVNGSGVVSSAWPFESGSRADSLSERAGLAAVNAVSLMNLDGETGDELVFRQDDSELTARTGAGELAEGWPVSTGAQVSGSPCLADLEEDGKAELFVPLADSLLWCFELPGEYSGGWWPVVGGWSYRNNSLSVSGGYVPVVGTGLIAGGRVYAQPNPSRGGSASIRFILGSAASVTVELFDISGRRVYSFSGTGFAAENSVVWQHVGVAPGVYVIRVEAEAEGRKDVAFGRVSVIN